MSVAEVIRVLIAREAQSKTVGATTESFLELAGIGEDRHPLISGLAVSERPEAYLTAHPHGVSKRKPKRSPVRRRTRT